MASHVRTMTNRTKGLIFATSSIETMRRTPIASPLRSE
jgi:hypothetical protein